MKRWCVFLCLFLVAAMVSAVTPMSKPDPVHAKVVPAENAKPGQVIEVKLDLDIASGWHTFTDKPDISGIIATQVVLDPSDLFEVDHIVYPKGTPEHSEVFQKDLNFYMGKVSISVFLKLSPKATGDIPVKGLLKFQACSDTLCLPPGKLPVSGIQKVTS